MSYKELITAHWKDGLAWLFCNGLGMLGLWGLGLIFFAFLDKPPWLELIDRGQVLLYSVGVLVQPMYVLTKERKTTTIPYRRMLTFGTLLCLMLSALLIGGYVVANVSGGPNIKADPAVLRYLGLFVLAISIIIGFLVAIADEQRESINFSDKFESGVDHLNTQIPQGSV